MIDSETAIRACIGVAAVATCLLTAVSWTAMSRLRSYGLERFESTSLPPPEALRNTRGDAIRREGLYQFYTSQLDFSSTAMFMHPTPGDVVEMLGKGHTGAGSGKDTLEAVSCVDTIFPRGETFGSCASRVVNSEPVKESVCRVRVYDATYDITKICLRMPITRAYASKSRERDRVEIELPPGSPSTAFFVLLRPLFVSLNGSSTYKVELYPQDRTVSNTLANYNSSVDKPLHVILSRVQEAKVATDVDEVHDRFLMNGIKAGGDSVSMNLFFLRFTGQTHRLGLDDPNSGRVLTLFLQLPEDILHTADPSDVSSTELLRINGAPGDIVVSFNKSVLVVEYAKSSNKIDVFPSSSVIVTFSDVLLAISVMTRSHVVYRTFELSAVFRLRDYGGMDAVLGQLHKSTGAMPAGLKPYTNAAIPELGDISFQLRQFPLRAFRKLSQ